MAKRRNPCPKVVPPGDIVRKTVKTLFNAWFPGGNPESALERLRTMGAHHRLMEIAYPETDDQDGMEYGGSIEAFEGDLSVWLDEAAASHAAHMRKIQERNA